MRHLDDPTYEALSRGDAETSAYFAEHLGGACEVCEAYLARHEGALGAAADAALHRASADAALDELGLRKVRRREQPRRRAVAGAVVAALVAAVLAVVVLPKLSARDDDRGVKAAVEPLSVELSAVLQTADGALRPLTAGAQVPDDGTVLLRYRASGAGRATLSLQRARGTEVLAEFDVEPGLHDLELEPGQPAGISLRGETGALTIALDVATRGAASRASIPLQVIPTR